MSAFVAVCSQLILIKSRALLPRRAYPAPPPDDGTDPEEDLRERLLLYKTYRDAGLRLADRLATGGMFHREPAAASAAGLAGAIPADEPPLDPSTLRAALAASIKLAPPEAQPPEVLPRTVTLEERAAVIRRALARAPRIVLQELLRDVTDRVVVAVTFMAMLELAKAHELTIEQHQPWGPIHVRGSTQESRGVRRD
jgi:segregation and condensation protein A